MSGAPLKVSPEGVEPEPRKSGHRYLDMIVAGAAILISCISLGVAVKHGIIMQKLVAASSWPLLQYTSGNVDDDTGKSFIGMHVQNVGIGPAVVKHFTVFYKGKAYASPDQFLAACCGYVVPSKRIGAGGAMTAFVNRSVIKAGDSRLYLGMELTPANVEVWERLDKARLNDMTFDICYCSVLGECWRSDLTGIDPQSVDECPVNSGLKSSKTRS